MEDYQSLSRSRGDCKYHVVFYAKKKKGFGALRPHLGETLRELANQKGAQIAEGHLMGDQSAA